MVEGRAFHKSLNICYFASPGSVPNSRNLPYFGQNLDNPFLPFWRYLCMAPIIQVYESA